MVDPIFIEKWLIGLCGVKSKSLVDLSYVQSNKQQGYLGLEFVNGQKISLRQIEQDLYRLDDRGVIMDGLMKLQTELSQAVSNY